MTESPFVKTEGPEPPDEADPLKEKHREMMAKLDAAVRDQLMKQSAVHIPENTAQISVEDRGIMFTTDTRSTYYQEQMQPDRDDVYRIEMELVRSRKKLALATDEIIRFTQRVRRYESKLIDAYQLIGQLVGYLDSIEWGTHDEWTRSQSLRERAHEYLTGNTTTTT